MSANNKNTQKRKCQALDFFTDYKESTMELITKQHIYIKRLERQVAALTYLAQLCNDRYGYTPPEYDLRDNPQATPIYKILEDLGLKEEISRHTDDFLKLKAPKVIEETKGNYTDMYEDIDSSDLKILPINK